MLVLVAIIPSIFSSIINWQISSISLRLKSGAIFTNNGGQLDKFLISAKNAKLSKKVKKIKASISAKS